MRLHRPEPSARRRRVAVVALAAVLAGGARADAIGQWRDPESGVQVATYPCALDAARLCGRIVAVPADAPQNDERNPDTTLRSRPLVGLEIVQSFEAVAPGRWEGGGDYGRRTGRIYVPANGDTLGDHRNRYQIAIDGDTLTISIANCRLLGCIGNRTWHRVAAAPTASAGDR